MYALVALAAAKWMGIPALFTPHCFYPSRTPLQAAGKWIFDQALGRLAFRLATIVIALTEVDRADAIHLGCPPDKVVLIPNAVDTEMLDAVTSVPPRHPTPFLLFVGRLDPVKRLTDLVEALAKLRDTNLSLVVVGNDAGGRHAAEQHAVSLGIASRVHFTGNVPIGELIGLYRAAASLVLPSAKEGLPTCVLEAMYLGCPVIASDGGGTRTLVRSGVNGFIYPSGHIDSLVAAIRRSLSMEQGSLRAAARLTIVRQYTWETTAKHIADLIDHLDHAHR